jgi:hypothetical protein
LMVVMGDQIGNIPWQIWLILLLIGLLMWRLSHHFIYQMEERKVDD